MKYCGWWFQIKFVTRMYWSRIADMFDRKSGEHLENQKHAAYNDQHFPKEF